MIPRPLDGFAAHDPLVGPCFTIVLTPLHDCQGIFKRGFDVGTMEQLKQQARRGGVRLPGSHSVVTAHRSIYTDPTYDMTEFIKPRNILRVQGKQCCCQILFFKRDRDHVSSLGLVLAPKLDLFTPL